MHLPAYMCACVRAHARVSACVCACASLCVCVHTPELFTRDVDFVNCTSLEQQYLNL
jgi:hypothetical protein